MTKFFKKTTPFILLISILSCFYTVYANVETDSPSYILMDKKSGRILLSKNENDKRPMASVTKIMTLDIILGEIHSGNLSLDDMVTASENSSKMGGSQIFLKANEKMNVDTMLKSIFVASANDASVAMAEHISGSVPAFVEKMNKKATDMGLENTLFQNPQDRKSVV